MTTDEIEIKRKDFAHTFIPENNLLKQIECRKFSSLSASAASKAGLNLDQARGLLQTVLTQIRPDKNVDLIWIQIVCCSVGIILKYFWGKK